jgi:hypothetical protein
MSARTYTIAIHKNGLLIACVPDGADIDEAIEVVEAAASVRLDLAEISIERGLTLTDDASAGEVLYRGCALGTLIDLNGKQFRYAVRVPRRSPGRPPKMKAGKSVKVYLDAPSLVSAAKLGDGNVSEGIRLALKHCSMI